MAPVRPEATSLRSQALGSYADEETSHGRYKHKDRADLEPLPELEGSINAVAPTFQADVHQHGFGSLSLGHAYGLFRTCCHADHLEPSRGELVLQVERDQDFTPR